LNVDRQTVVVTVGSLETSVVTGRKSDGGTVNKDKIDLNGERSAQDLVDPGRLGTDTWESSTVDQVKNEGDVTSLNRGEETSGRNVNAGNRGGTEDNDEVTDGPLTVAVTAATEGKTSTIVGTDGEDDFDINVGVGSLDWGGKDGLTVVTDSEVLVVPGTDEVEGESNNDGLSVGSGGDTSDNSVITRERTKDVGKTIDTEVDSGKTNLALIGVGVG